MLDLVAQTIRRHVMFTVGDKVGVAVSGGPDSVALLHILVKLAPDWNLHLKILHLNHLLRGDASQADAQFVADLAAQLHLPWEIRETDVAALAARTGDNLEQAGRRARREFFNELLASRALDRIALGHTRSDQAETVLFRLLRGSGITGLAGIRPVTADGIVRPLIGITRAEVMQFLENKQLPWRDDATNADLHFARNRIRHQLLPQLTTEWNPSLAATLANLAELSQTEERYWDREITLLARTHLIAKPTSVLFRAAQVAALDQALSRRLLRRAVELAKGDVRGLEFAHVEQMLQLAQSSHGSGHVTLPGLVLTRSFEWLRLAPPESPPPDYTIPLAIPCTCALPGTGKTLYFELLDDSRRDDLQSNRYNKERGSVLDVGRVTEPLELTNFRPGDQLWPAGASKPVKVKVLFHRSRVPSWERPLWPIIRSGKSVVWVRQFGVAQGWTPQPGSERVLRIRESEE